MRREETTAQAVIAADLPAAIYADFMRRWPAHDVWAFRHWKTKHNCHVEHWHGASLPGRAA